MLLLSGGTGFVGRSLLRHLGEAGTPVRTLLRPSKTSPDLPRGVPTEVALAGLSDRRGLRAAMIGVERVIHLAAPAGERLTAAGLAAEADGARNLGEAAADAGVKQLLFVSHLGADRASAYPSLRAAAIAEEHLRRSGVPVTVLRAAVPYGPGDRFTTSLATLIAVSPFFFPLPGDGRARLQPLWVEDLARCVVWSIEDPAFIGATIELGGPEQLTLREIVEIVLQVMGAHRGLTNVRPPYLRAAAWLMERILPDSPATTSWIDYFAANRMTDLNSASRSFRLQPARMEKRLDYLRGRNWAWELPARQLRRLRGQPG
jgi:NADH dehydrogenase